jgi:hypothetical protein
MLCLPVYSAAPKAAAGPRRIRIPVWADGPLKAADLAATLDGSSSRVLSLRGPDDDLMLLIVLDLVGDPSSVELAKQALISQIRALPPLTVVGLLRAQDGLKVIVDPTADREQVAEAVTGLPIGGKAGLLDTIETAGRIAEYILAKTAVRVALLYVTDGGVSDYREDFTNPVINSSDSHDLSRKFPEALIQEKISMVGQALTGQQTPLFVAHLRDSADRINDAYQNGLKQLAETTGGTAALCRSSGEIQEVIERTMSLIVHHYSVTLALPERVGKSVQVGLEAEGHTLNYRSHFYLRTR